MIAVFFLSCILAVIYSLPFATLFQSAGYRFSVCLKRGKKYYLLSVAYFAVFAAAGILFRRFDGLVFRILSYSLFLPTVAFLFLIFRKMHLKIHPTRRFARLLSCQAIVYAGAIFPLVFTDFSVVWCVSPILAPFALLIAAFLLQPIEKLNNDRYSKRAKRRLSEMKATKIGITGSYGKTSVKTALNAFLSELFSVAVTPANYNTPLGIAKTLKTVSGEEDFFIAEMGARRKGDIRELCDLVSPDLGILTGIAPQHLETFGSIQAILAEKNELARSVPEKGCVFFNVADDLVRVLSEKRSGEKRTVGFERADYLIENLRISSNGTAFDLVFGGKRLAFETPLLGKGSAIDVALAASVALFVGADQEKIVAAAKNLKPAPHRLEAIRKGDLLILDDSYNVNPIGVKVALETLDAIEGKRKLVYTSGMVELGEKETENNFLLGKEIARVSDLAIVLSGRYGDLVVKGLLSSCFPKESIVRVGSTEEATALFSRLVRSGDVLLITSDLPQEYRL